MAFRPTGGTHSVEAMDELCPAIKVGSGVGIPSPPAIAFKPPHFTRGKDGAPSVVVAPLSADADKGDQDTLACIPYDLFQVTAPINRQNRTTESPCHTLAKDNAQHGAVVAFRENTRNEVDYVDPPQALASGGGKPGQGYCGIQHGMQVRRLTPSECEALQGFPENYTAVPYRNKPAADGPRYRALGNSMAVPCMWWLGHRIHQATR